ncbi:MAG: tetratricopeptide repeat protein [Pirellulales bacterium]|nr:tetratricopeptide repeat protein [Pirellulales bacterium]
MSLASQVTSHNSAPATRVSGTGMLWLLLLLGMSVAGSLLPAIADIAGHEFFATWLTHEDGPYEAAGALACLAAAILLTWINLQRRRNGQGANWLLLLLAAALLLMFLEEISWGQRLFAISAPQWLARANIQEEINLHNLRIFHPHLENNWLKRLWLNASLFYLGLLPLLTLALPPLRRLALRCGLPWASWQLALSVCVTYGIYLLLIITTVTRGDLYAAHDAGEAVEAVIEFAYLVLAIETLWLLRGSSVPLRWRSLLLALIVLVGPPLAIMAWGSAKAIAATDSHLSAIAALRQGNKLLAAGKPSAAIDRYLESARLWPEKLETRFRLAGAAEQVGDVALAGQQYQAVLAADPQNADAHNGLGLLMFKSRRFDAAASEFRQALEIAESAEIQNNLGAALAQSGQWNDARRAFEAALRLDPANQRAKENLELLDRRAPR